MGKLDMLKIILISFSFMVQIFAGISDMEADGELFANGLLGGVKLEVGRVVDWYKYDVVPQKRLLRSIKQDYKEEKKETVAKEILAMIEKKRAKSRFEKLLKELEAKSQSRNPEIKEDDVRLIICLLKEYCSPR